MENRIKECQGNLSRTGHAAATKVANQLRLCFAPMAYGLLCALRRIEPAHARPAVRCGSSYLDRCASDSSDQSLLSLPPVLTPTNGGRTPPRSRRLAFVRRVCAGRRQTQLAPKWYYSTRNTCRACTRCITAGSAGRRARLIRLIRRARSTAPRDRQQGQPARSRRLPV
jgi:hypothetical protein